MLTGQRGPGPARFAGSSLRNTVDPGQFVGRIAVRGTVRDAVQGQAVAKAAAIAQGDLAVIERERDRLVGRKRGAGLHTVCAGRGKGQTKRHPHWRPFARLLRGQHLRRYGNRLGDGAGFAAQRDLESTEVDLSPGRCQDRCGRPSQYAQLAGFRIDRRGLFGGGSVNRCFQRLAGWLRQRVKRRRVLRQGRDLRPYRQRFGRGRRLFQFLFLGKGLAGAGRLGGDSSRQHESHDDAAGNQDTHSLCASQTLRRGERVLSGTGKDSTGS